jgi:hypothetical protein
MGRPARHPGANSAQLGVMAASSACIATNLPENLALVALIDARGTGRAHQGLIGCD